MGRRPAGLLLAAILALTGCSDATAPDTGDAFLITPDQRILEAGAELQLAAALISADGDTTILEDVLWSSSDPDIVSVSASGLASAHRSGAATIVALVSGGRATAPISVERRFKASALAVGEDHVCALDLEGRAWCFGQDRGGSLGTGTFWQYTKTMTGPVLHAPVFSAIAVTWKTSCGLSLAGQIWCWGYNPTDGDLGHFPGGTDSAIPVLADTLRSYQIISGGSSHICGLSSNVVYCWGLRYHRPRAPLADEALRFSDVAVGVDYDCGVTMDGSALCWSEGFFASASGPSAPRFTRVESASDGISADYFCGLSVDAAVFCWGSNTVGQLGNGTMQPHAEPERIQSQHRFTDITTHGYHACGVTDSGVAFCWGANTFGQLGSGDSTGSATPRQVRTSVRFIDIETFPGTNIGPGTSRVCAISTDQDLFCWGEGFGPVPEPVLH